MKNVTGSYEIIPKEEASHISHDKKCNLEYWDSIENDAEKAIKKIAAHGGINIINFNDLAIIKEVTECITGKVKECFPEADYPYVDQEY